MDRASRARDLENTRVKDLADMIWYVERYSFASAALIDASAATFDRRGEHRWPPEIPPVPDSWSRPYGALRNEMRLDPETPAAARDKLARFLEPNLTGDRGMHSDKGIDWRMVR